MNLDPDVSQGASLSPISDDVLDHLESSIPELARAATNHAYWEALATGHSVVISESGTIYRVFPNGSRAVVPPILSSSEPTREGAAE